MTSSQTQLDAPEMRCPTCAARQAPSSECRRCRCDLSLVLAIHQQRQRLRRNILRHLHKGNHALAVQAARQLWSLSTDPDSARLLAACYLFAHRYQAAIDLRSRAEKKPGFSEKPGF